jgi:CheY-like chemotaxis protein
MTSLWRHDRPRTLDCQVTTKPEGNGTRLGLPVVHGIVQARGGHILIESRVGEGTDVSVYLPTIQSPTNGSPETADAPLRGGTQSILLVEDRPVVLKMEQTILERLGYQVAAYARSLEALEAFRNHPHSFHLLFTDMTMPQLTGARLAEEILKIRPDIPIVTATGFSEQMNPEIASKMRIDSLLMKPVGVQDIAAGVRSVLDQVKDSPER